jgi:hypothetical protein
MKKSFSLTPFIIATLLFSSVSCASGGYGHRHEHEHGWEHHHEHHHYYPQERVQYREVVKYYPQPRYYTAPRYYAPPPRYYPQPQPRYQSYQDPRSTQGLAGGVIGSVFGYELGAGDPIATGLGAAAGSYLGNNMAGRR